MESEGGIAMRALLLAVAVLVAGCASQSREISQAEYSDALMAVNIAEDRVETAKGFVAEYASLKRYYNQMPPSEQRKLDRSIEVARITLEETEASADFARARLKSIKR